MPPPLTVVIPAYNEAAAIAAGRLAEVAAWRDAHVPTGELLVVDDGSTDGTASAAASVADRVLTITHGGKAAALAAGFRAARGEAVLFTDMDLATPMSDAAGLLRALDAGADLAVGSRGLHRPGAPPSRLLLSTGQVMLRLMLLGMPLVDTQCGFKAFRRTVALDLLDRLRVYSPDRPPPEGPSVTSGFDVELLFVARRQGYRIAEVPVRWHYAHSSHVDLRRDARRGVLDLVRIARARLTGAYGQPHP